jgi:hypothetical protein
MIRDRARAARSARHATLCLLLALAASGTTARADEAAPADTTLGRYLGGLRDSTDVYFGRSAAPLDTAGLDSSLAWGLAHPDAPRRPQSALTLVPTFRFNRADGPVYGGTVGLGHLVQEGRITGRLSWAVGPRDLLGGAAYERRLVRGPAEWRFSASGGRRTNLIDRERSDKSFAAFRALTTGSDSRHYMREDGFSVSLQRETPVWRIKVGYNDDLQSPLPTTTTWSLSGARADPIFNLPARFGRMREIEYEAGVQLPVVPVFLQAQYATASDAIGSDFEYRRSRLAASGDWALGESFSIVPQVAYGRLSGEAVPQASFYMGGTRSLRSIKGSSRGGTGLALARLDLIGHDDVLALMRIPHPDAFPLHMGAFIASGVVWGVDPYGGPTIPGLDWPNREDWLHEAGIQVLFRPGIPESDGYLRISYAWPLGPADRDPRWTITYSRALDLVDRIAR